VDGHRPQLPVGQIKRAAAKINKSKSSPDSKNIPLSPSGKSPL